MGGQTALNTALSLRKLGALEKYDIELIGASADAIDKAEDRELLPAGDDEDRPRRAARASRSRAICATRRTRRGNFLYDGSNNPIMELSPEAFAQALPALDEVGLPAVIRPSFTLGGTGGGIAYNREEFFEIVEQGLDASPTNEVLIEESVLGWKEFEMEVVRDTRRQRHHHLLHREHRCHGRAHRRFHHRRPRPDPDRQGISAHALGLDRGAARDRRGDRRLECAVRGQPRGRTHGRHRDEPARVAFFGAGLEGHRLSHRQDRGQARGGLHARRTQERHHAR